MELTARGERVDQLFLEGPKVHIGPLGDIEDILGETIPAAATRLVDAALVQGPEPPQNPEKTGLSGPIWARHQEVRSRWHPQAQIPDQRGVCRSYHHGSLEGNLVF